MTKPLKLNHSFITKGKSCVHVGGDRSVCGAEVLKGAPHGWLCWYHAAAVHHTPKVALEGLAPNGSVC